MTQAASSYARIEGTEFLDGKMTLLAGDCLAALDAMDDDTFRLTLSESRILNLLVRRAQVAKASMYEALYGDRIAGPEPKILDVLVHRMRRKLEPHEVVVETVTGVGYRLAPEMRAKIEALLS